MHRAHPSLPRRPARGREFVGWQSAACPPFPMRSAERWWARFALPTLVLARSVMLASFREERPNPRCRPGWAADDRIATHRSFEAPFVARSRSVLHRDPNGLNELKVRIHKEGSTKMTKHITICAGIDTGKSSST